jgi:hypothetical protein
MRRERSAAGSVAASAPVLALFGFDPIVGDVR